MRKRYQQTSLVLISSLVLAVLMLYLFPTPVTQAASTCTPTSSTTPNIDMVGTSFLSATDPNVITKIQVPSGGLYICGNEAVFPQYSLPTYADFRSAYYDQKTFASANKIPLSGDQTQAAIDLSLNEKIYWIEQSSPPLGTPGNLTISSNITVSKSGVVFMDGDLIINSDLINNNPTTGLVFVAGGNVWIKSTVNRVDAFIITHGTFCSAYEILGSPCPATLNALTLTVNGSLIYLNNSPSSTPGDKPKFARATAFNNNTPGEVFNYQPKYFGAAKNVFAKTRFIWTESK